MHFKLLLLIHHVGGPVIVFVRVAVILSLCHGNCIERVIHVLTSTDGSTVATIILSVILNEVWVAHNEVSLILGVFEALIMNLV